MDFELRHPLYIAINRSFPTLFCSNSVHVMYCTCMCLLVLVLGASTEASAPAWHHKKWCHNESTAGADASVDVHNIANTHMIHICDRLWENRPIGASYNFCDLRAKNCLRIDVLSLHISCSMPELCALETRSCKTAVLRNAHSKIAKLGKVR